jgi:hypothetical protein
MVKIHNGVIPVRGGGSSIREKTASLASEDFVIRYDVPIPQSPDKTGGRGRRPRYPFADMKVGAFLKGVDKSKRARNIVMSAYAYAYRMRNKGEDVRFVCTLLADGTYGVWRRQ